MPETTCSTGKIAYASRHAAANSRGNGRNRGRRMRTYFCERCHRWHLTTETVKENRS